MSLANLCAPPRSPPGSAGVDRSGCLPPVASPATRRVADAFRRYGSSTGGYRTCAPWVGLPQRSHLLTVVVVAISLAPTGGLVEGKPRRRHHST